MAKNKISEWSSTAANNTDVGGIDIAEGCAPSGINNAIREVMAQVKDMITGADGDNLSVGGNLTVAGTASGVTPASSDNSTKFATTAYVQTKVGTLGTMSSQNANAVAITGGTISGITDLAVADGGTGASTLTGAIIGNGTSAMTAVAPSTSGNVLTSNGTTWVSQAIPQLGFASAASASASTTITLAAGTWFVSAWYRYYDDNFPATSLVIDGVTVDSVPDLGDPSGTSYIVLFGGRQLSGGRTITVSATAAGSTRGIYVNAYRVA